MIASSLFISFVSKGMTQVRKDFKFTNNAISNIVIGIIYFSVIAVSFFLSYKIVFREGAFDGIKSLFKEKAAVIEEAGDETNEKQEEV